MISVSKSLLPYVVAYDFGTEEGYTNVTSPVAEQRAKQMEKPEEWHALGQCTVTIVVQYLH